MTIQVELTPETEARLTAAARARGVAPEKYAGSLLHDVLASSTSGTGRLTIEEFHKMLDALAQGSERLPNIPTEAFTRESFYEDRT
jgi:hypothetical protein